MSDNPLRGAIGMSSYVAPPKNLFDRFLKFVGNIIRWITGSKFSHTFLWIWNDATLGPMVYEAADLGVTVNFADPAGYLNPDKYFVKIYKPLTNPMQINNGLFVVRRLNGRPYGYFQLVGFLFVYAWKFLTRQSVNNPFKSGIICSELVIIYLKEVFPDDVPIKKMDRNTTSPEDIYEYMERNPQMFEEITIPK